jgi:hypothetical protein
MGWDAHEILECAYNGLTEIARHRDLEQAVYGIDALDELGLHPLIHQAFRAGSLGVWPEQRYPSDRKPRGRKSEGQRCDVVLTAEGRLLQDPDAEATLFGDEDSVSFDAAYWLEIKTVAQFTPEGPFARYASELLSPVTRDIRKLSQDRGVYHAGLLLVLFTEDEQTAQHDLDVWQARGLQKGFPIGPGLMRFAKITDRIGNGCLAVALFPVRRL